jgi:hypothetical protein
VPWVPDLRRHAEKESSPLYPKGSRPFVLLVVLSPYIDILCTGSFGINGLRQW